MLEVDGAIVDTDKDVKNFLFGSLDVPLVNLEMSLKNYVSVPRELSVSLCIVQCSLSYSLVFVQYRFKNLQKSLLILNLYLRRLILFHLPRRRQ